MAKMLTADARRRAAVLCKTVEAASEVMAGGGDVEAIIKEGRDEYGPLADEYCFREAVLFELGRAA